MSALKQLPCWGLLWKVNWYSHMHLCPIIPTQVTASVTLNWSMTLYKHDSFKNISLQFFISVGKQTVFWSIFFLWEETNFSCRPFHISHSFCFWCISSIFYTLLVCLFRSKSLIIHTALHFLATAVIFTLPNSFHTVTRGIFLKFKTDYILWLKSHHVELEPEY